MRIDEHRNSKFDPDEAYKQIANLSASWWRKTSQSGLAISDEDIRDILQSQERIKGRIDAAFSQVLEIAMCRQENLKRYENLRFTSLGEDCFSRTVLTRWGFKAPAALGEKSNPFDLSVHPVTKLISLLENDFEGYLDDGNLEFSEKANYCRNVKYNIEFNHEKGPEYALNNFEILKNSIQPRVARMQQQMTDQKRTCFVLHIRNPASANLDNIHRLWEVVRRKFNGNDNFLICVNTWKSGEKPDSSFEFSNISDKIISINKPYPFPGYVWFNHGHTEKGHLFEREFVASFNDSLRLMI